MIKKYYRLQFRLVSSMNIGSGLNEITDKDLLKNSKEEPYIPGTTLAGMYRKLFSEEEAEKYFGNVTIQTEHNQNGEKNKAKESKVVVYNANILNENYKISKRDCVGLDEYKTAINGAKFDFEILEPGVSFVTYIEQNIKEQNENDSDIGKEVVKQWLAGNIAFGAKTMRGLGKTELEQVHKVSFDLSKKDEKEANGLEQWLDFDLYEEITEQSLWKPEDLNKMQQFAEQSEKKITIKLNLQQAGGISIRKYTTAINLEDSPQPDYEQMSYIRIEDGEEKIYPVIPGTSWAGAFKHQIEKIDKTCIKNVFGAVKQKMENHAGEDKQQKSYKSKIYFSESELVGATPKMITRNAIDRFTNATIQGALYTEKTYYGGKTELEISLDQNVSKEFKHALAAAIVDLHMGFMAVGGLTSVGRGLFKIEKITVNKKEIAILEDDTFYNELKAAIV